MLNPTLTVGNNGFVKLVDSMGTDLSVVNAARVSMGKRKEVFEPEDEKLIYYLARHGHLSPFRHAFLSFHIKGPLFTKGQFDKHQVGISINTISGRYVQTADDWYSPEFFRKSGESIKQGSTDEPVEHNDIWMLEYTRHYENTIKLYESMVASGICREQARTILPQGMNTEFFMSGSLQAFIHFIKLRTDSHAQREIQIYGQAIKQIIGPLFPVSLKALMEL